MGFLKHCVSFKGLSRINYSFHDFLRRCKRLKGTYATPPEQDPLKQALEKKIPAFKEAVIKLRKEHGNYVMGKVTINTVLGGMRGLPALVCDTSELDPIRGITFRGISVADLYECLPLSEGGNEPLPESVFWLLLTGDIPTREQVKFLSKEWACRSDLPQHVIEILDRTPKEVHPMKQLIIGLAALSNESEFAKKYAEGLNKADYWHSTYQDAMNLLAKMPRIAAKIFNNIYKKHGDLPEIDYDCDWSYNFAKMLCFDDPQFHDLLRLYLSIHCDHEGGNVSSHASHLVGSALSDAFLSCTAAMCGLAGPLHGLANQECLIFMQELLKKTGPRPTEEKVKEYCVNTLKSGKVIPGYGHAVLRVTDPRFTAFQNFARKHKPDHEIIQIVEKLSQVVPEILKATGKVSNPFPNIDGSSGAVLKAFGMEHMHYYTVLFGVSRAMGCMAQLIWARALGCPLERPKSFSTKEIINSLCNPKN